MLKSLHLKNFRKWTDNTLNFEPGLVAIRAPNEGGKSTLIEALMYLWFGARSLREKLDDVVTRGAAKSSLRVTGVHEFNGRTYKTVRHQGGAEIYVDDNPQPYLTGQNEVTKFWTELLGADAQRVTQLMVAEQGELRGIFSTRAGQGAAAVEMIENLADFDIFDFVLSELNRTLETGSDVILKSKIETLEKTLAEGPDLGALEGEVGKRKEALEQAEAQYQEAKKVEADAVQQTAAAKAALDDVAKAQLGYDRAKGTLDQERDSLAKLNKDLADLGEAEPQRDLTGLESELESARVREQVANVKRNLESYAALVNELPTVWDGSLADFNNYHADAKKTLDGLTGELSTLRAERNAIIVPNENDTVCASCGQELTNAQDIKRHIEEARARRDALDVKIQGVAGDVDQQSQTMDVLNAISDVQNKGTTLAESEFVAVDASRVPFRLSLKSGVDSSGDRTVSEVRLELEKAREFNTEQQVKVSRLEVLSQGVEQQRERVISAEAWLAEFGERPDDSTASNRLAAAQAKQDEAVSNTQAAVDLSRRAGSELQQAISLLESTSRERTNLEVALENAKSQLGKLVFNNNLVKKIRTIRPQVSDTLWTMVLSSASAHFTRLRGEETIITKTPDGFAENGYPVTGLSGSAQAILGAAIRNALIRLFMPNIGMMIYDEPFAFMDTNRIQEMLGFILSSDFNQTIVVTHEDVTETLADQVIEF